MRRLVLASAVLAAPLLSCHDAGPVVPATVTVAFGVTQLEVSDTTRATATAADASGKPITGLPVAFASANAAIARVDSTGLVTALTQGTVSITATIRGVSGGTPMTVVLTVSSVTLTLPSSTLDVGDTTRAVTAAVSPKGVAVTGRTVTYGSSNAAVATVSAAGTVRAESVGSATITATIDGKSGSAPVAVQSAPASVRIDQASPRIDVGGSTQLTAAALDATGAAMPGRAIAWSSADSQRVAVSSTGLATWRAPGRAIVTARSGTVSSTVEVTAAGDFAITGVHFTQGVQEADGSVPMIPGDARAAALVLMTTQARVTTTMRVVLRLLNGDNSLWYSDTVVVTDAIDVSASLALPTVRFLIPAAKIKSGLSWQVVRDPTGVTPDDSATTDVFPRNGPATFAVVDAPPLHIRFVPITLTAHGNTTPSISQSDLGEYLRTVRSTLPVGAITATIGTAFATSASFGSGTSGGASFFWTQVLAELDLARVADPTDPSAYWFGVVSPPSGFTFTSFGGFGYIPGNPDSTGALTRTALGVRIGWFSNQTQARDNVAHELGHNFGRQHTPCGNPSSPDASYPRPDGRLGQLMHDVYSWSGSSSSTLPTIPETNGDLMGYCFPLWSSGYTYKGIIAGRGTTAPAIVAAATTDVLVIQGSVRLDGQGAPTLLPTVAIRGRPTRPDAGDHHLLGYDDAGSVLFDFAFTPTQVDHAPELALFTFALPADAAVQRLARIRVSGPTGTAVLDEAAGAPGVSDVRRNANGTVAVACADSKARVAVQDEATGRLLGISTSGALTMTSAARRLAVSCGRGARPARAVFSVR